MLLNLSMAESKEDSVSGLAGAATCSALPAGSWDCHIHVFPDPSRFPFSDGRRYTPETVEPADARNTLRLLGADHAVIQHATPYGEDNASLLWSVSALAGVAVGIAACPGIETMSNHDPEKWALSGIAGFRVHDTAMGRQTESILSSADAWLAGSQMHLDLHARSETVHDLIPVISGFKIPVVLDHFAGIPLEKGQVPKTLRMLMDYENIWLKLSAAYRVKGMVSDGIADSVACLMDLYPTRCLWGSDWPHTPPHPDHPGRRKTVLPFRKIDTVSEVINLSASLTDDQKLLLFRDNPARLYSWALARG